MIGRGVVLSQCRGWSFQNFPWDAYYKTNDPRIVKFSLSMFEAGNNCMARSILRQSRGSLRKISQRSSYQYSSNIHWVNGRYGIQGVFSAKVNCVCSSSKNFVGLLLCKKLL